VSILSTWADKIQARNIAAREAKEEAKAARHAEWVDHVLNGHWEVEVHENIGMAGWGVTNFAKYRVVVKLDGRIMTACYGITMKDAQAQGYSYIDTQKDKARR
jgi:hypothetical protein